LKYQKSEVPNSYELLTLKIRYKDPDSKVSKEFSRVLQDIALEDNRVSQDFKFASSVVEFGLLLRNSSYKGDASYQRVLKRVRQSLGEDLDGRRNEFLELVEHTCELLGIDEEETYQGLKYKK